MNAVQPLLEVDGLSKEYPLRTGRTVRALDGISFTLGKAETLGLVGESGSGKTTAGRCILRLIEPTSGRVMLEQNDILSLDRASLTRLRPRMQMVFQDPQSFLNPRMTIGEAVAEPLLLNGIKDGVKTRVAELLEEVGLSAAESGRRPHMLSGGQKQRVGIARALALRPSLVIADEPLSALDVSVRAQILDLLAALKARHGLSYLFIAHDLRAVASIADRVAVMYLGRIVEMAPAGELFSRPRHPYTEALLAALPITDPRQRNRPRIRVQGEIPDPAHPPAGCRFHPRCPHAREICTREDPPLVAIGAGSAACHFTSELSLAGLPS